MILLILLGCLVCLFPLGLYCIWLAQVNSRPHPARVNGGWDFAGLLLGLSGFILFGGYLVLLATDASWRLALAGGRFERVRNALANLPLSLWLVSAGYFFLVVAGSISLIRHRSQFTSYYNMTLADFEPLFRQAVERLGLTLRQNGLDWIVSAPPTVETNRPALELVRLRIEGSAAMEHVTTRWYDDRDETRQLLERELDKLLPSIVAGKNDVAGWAMTAASACFVAILFSMALLIMITYARRFG